MLRRAKSDNNVEPPVVEHKKGYGVSRFNAVKHGILSQYTILPWENRAEYEELLNALVAEYAPQGPTEEHFVEEIAGIMWRKRRRLLGERALHFRALQRTVGQQYHMMSKAALVLAAPDFQGRGVRAALSIDEDEDKAALTELQDDEHRAINAFNILNSEDGTFDRAFAELNKGQQEELRKRGITLHTPNTESLIHFIETSLFPTYRDQRHQLNNQSLIRDQAFGESIDATGLEALSRQEVRLDRKLERTIAMLLKLQSLRLKSGDTLLVAEATHLRRPQV